MTDAPQLEKAKLIPMNGDQADTDAAIDVQFNPETLKVGLSNTLQAENQSGGQTSAAQYVSKSESTLSLTLVFDTSVDSPRTEAERDEALDSAIDQFLEDDNQTVSEFLEGLRRDSEQAAERLDVRSRTKQIADLFMQPQNPTADRPSPPKRCRFQWGSFAFVGMVSSYDETLDFFSPEGLPLRAQLALTLKEDRYQFEQVAQPEPAAREQPRFAPGGGSLPEAARNAGQQPKNWRDMALFNGVESPRLAASLSLSAPGVSLSGSASVGGAAIAAGGISGGLSGGFSASFGGPSVSASFSGPAFSASASGGASASLSAGLAGGVSASFSGPSASFSASAAPARASFSVGGSQALGTDVPGAFISLGGTGATAQAHAATGRLQAQMSATAGAQASATAGVGASASGGASASARLNAQARASADFDFDTA